MKSAKNMNMILLKDLSFYTYFIDTKDFVFTKEEMYTKFNKKIVMELSK